MTPRIFAYIVHRDGIPDDSAAELASAARRIDPDQAPVALVTGCGPGLDSVCDALRAWYGEVWKIGADALSYPNAEVVRKALASLIPPGSIVLVPHTHFGVDLAPGLSVKLNAAYVPDVLDMGRADGASLKLVRQEFGGQFNTHVHCDISAGAVITIRPGAFPAGNGGAANGQVVDRSGGLGALTAGRRYLETIACEAGDVDISNEPVLVSIGRGIQEKENVALAEELAEAMGAAVSCSRPVVDARWLDKSRQVGSSGRTVKPKVYLACGISGSFQHLAGIKGNPFLVAINKNPAAPIFRAADVGIVDDILEFLPELAAGIREAR